METEKIREIAFRVRQAIASEIQTTNNYLGFALKNFPSGSCELCTTILGLYLRTKGYDNVSQCVGARWDETLGLHATHVWLILDTTLIIDITADQFSDCTEQVIVSNSSEFHEAFRITDRRPIDPTYLNCGDIENYYWFYENVVARLVPLSSLNGFAQ